MTQYSKAHIAKNQEKLDDGMSMPTLLHKVSQAIFERGGGVKKVRLPY